jgi:hypothetical protein
MTAANSPTLFVSRSGGSPVQGAPDHTEDPNKRLTATESVTTQERNFLLFNFPFYSLFQFKFRSKLNFQFQVQMQQSKNSS